MATAQAEVVPTISFSGPASYIPGSATDSTYTLVLGNTGATTSTNGRVTTSFPAGATISWSCGGATGSGTSCAVIGSGSGNLSNKDPGTLAQNGTVTYTFLVRYPSSSAADPLTVGAQFDDNESNPDNDVVSDSVSSARDARSDLAVTAGGAPTTYVPGATNGTLAFTVTNNGPTDSSAATLSIPLPTGATAASWSCSTAARCSPSSGSGAVATAVTLTDGQSVTVNFTSIAYQSSATANPMNWIATVTAVNETDGTAANNSATKALTRDPQTDYAVAFVPAHPIATPGSYIPGSTGNVLAIRVTNNGPTDSGPAPVVLNFPAAVSAVSWSCSVPARCSPASGTGNVATNVTLANDASVDINLSISYGSGALTSPLDLVTTVTAAAGEDDTPTGNNSATNRYTIDRRADVRVVKVGDAAANPGSAFDYSITVSNVGPSDVGNGTGETGALLTDTFPAQLQGDPIACAAEPATPCWEYCPDDGGTVGAYTVANCPGEVVRGSGPISDASFKLRAGSSSVVRAYVAVGGAVSGSISNTATVRITDSGVTDPGAASNNTSTFVTLVQINTDVAVAKTDGVTSAVPGQLHSYTITVRNDGFITANNVAVADTLPLFGGAITAGFDAGTISWQCSASGGACCNTNSANCGVGTPTAPIIANTLAAAVDLPGQSQVVFTVTGRLNTRASGTMSNTATATLPAGITDSAPANNSSVDNNTVMVPQGSPTISKVLTGLQALGAGGVGPPYRLSYRITVGNGGPSFINDATVSDPLISPLLSAASATWTCTVVANPPGGLTQCAQPSGTGALSVGVDLDPQGAAQIDLVVDTVANASGQVSNTATISSSAGTASSSLTSSLSGQANLALSKTDLRSSAVPGDDTEYVITVTNDGPDDVFGARVTDLFPPELENVSWTCSATTPVPGDLAEFGTFGASNTAGHALAASSDGRHVYVVGTAAHAVFAFQRDNVPGVTFGAVATIETETNGVNDPLDSGAAVTDMAAPIDVALSPDGAMLYVLSQTAIVSFNRTSNAADPNYGKLSFAGSAPAGMPATPRRLLVTAQNLYVSGDAVVSIYRRDQVTGLPVFDIQHGTNMPAAPGPLAMSSTDSLLFVASSSGQQLSSFAINTVAGATPIGRLTHVTSLSDAHFAGATDLAVAPVQRHLYIAAGGAARVSRLGYTTTSLTKTGSYSQADLTIPGGQPDPLVGTLRLALAADGEHLLVSSLGVNPAGYLVQFRRDTVGGGLDFEALLIRNLPAAEHLGLSQAADVMLTSDGRHVLIASASTDTRPLTVYSRRAPDPLFAFIERDRQGDSIPGGGTLSGLTAAADVVVSPDGRHVYAIGLQDHSLVAFTRTSTSGLTPATAGQHLEYLARYLEASGGISGLHRPSALQISSDGRSVYVSSEEGNSLAVFDRDHDDGSPNFGRLTFRQVLRDNIGGVDGLLGARGIALDHDGNHVYVAGSFESAISIFRRDASLNLNFVGQVRSGSEGVTGLGGIRDLVVTRDGQQLLGVGSISNAVVVFNRDDSAVSPTYGRLAFLQARVLGASDRLVALTLPDDTDPAANEHVYVAAENGNRVYALRRILDPASAAFGTLQLLFQYSNNSGGITFMNGPRDIRISADGDRVYVGAQFGHSVLVFDRDTNRSSAAFGSLSLVELRRDGVGGVDGLNTVYAIAVSPDSRNVYAAGFGDNAVASFVVGTGSSCSAGGSGDIDDTVDIGAGGTLVYRASARIRPDAVGTLSNTALVELPPRFSDNDLADNTQTDSTALTPRADLSVSKTNDRVSVVAGETVTYEVVVRNAGLSNIVHSGANPFTLTDVLGAGFDVASAQWSCVASGSGALDYVDGYFDDQGGVTGLAGVSGMVLVPDADGGGPLAAYLASVSVLDGSLNLFTRDAIDGTLTPALGIAQGSTLNGSPIDGLAGARAVVASADGKFLYVASRTSDAVSVFELGDDGAGQLRADLVEVQRGLVGLDQALHLVLSPDADGDYLYVAGANDDAIAVFARDNVTGELTWLESEQNGVNDPLDVGGVVAGLDGVEYLVASPDGAHLYALSGAGGSIATFAVDAGSGRLSWQRVIDGNDVGVSMAGASSAVFAVDGSSMYVTAADANRLLVLDRDAASGSGTFGSLAYADSLTQDVAGVQGLLAPSRAALTADGVHLYVTARSGGSVAWFIRDPADGSVNFLGLRSNESAGVDGLSGATDVIVDDALNQVYVAGTQQGAIAQFARQVDSYCPPSGSGNLNAIPLRIAAGGSVTFTIVVDVASGYSGTLQNTVTLDSNQDTDPGNNTATDIDTVSVVADLAITKTDGLAEYDGLAGATAMAGDADQVYVAGSVDNAVGVYDRIDAPGMPEHGSLVFNSVLRSGQAGVVGLAAVNDVLLSADGDHIYATSPTDSSVATFRRNRTNGTLSFVEIEQNGVLGVSGLSGARALAQSPDGAHVYVAGGFANAIAVFARETNAGSADYGRLSYRGLVQNGVGGVDGIGEPVALDVSPDGRHVYVLGAATDSIAVFTRNPNPGSGGFGMLSYSTRYLNGQGGFAGLAGVRSLLIRGDGSQVYVLADEEGNLVRLARDTVTGALSPGQVLADGVAGNGDSDNHGPSAPDGVPATSGLLGAQRMRWSADQAQIYVAGTEADAIARFAVAAGDGAVSFVDRINNGDPAPLTGGQVLGLDGVRDVLSAADPQQLYSVSALDAAVATFERATADGALAFRAALFDGLGGVAPGESVTYLITATNNGPSNVVGATVTDVFPDAFTQVAWTCTPSGGASCLASGVGSINTPVNLPIGGRVAFVATGVVGDGVSGRLINTASISSSGNLDPVVGNNSATDGDTVLSPAMDLVTTVSDGATVSVPGNRVDYTVTVGNLGPTYATAATVSDLIPPALYNVAWSCTAEPVAGTLSSTQNLLAPATAYSAVAVGALGNFVYSSGVRANKGVVVVHARNPLDGSLSELEVHTDTVAGVAGLGGASDIVLSPDQRFVYVAGSGADAIAVFARDTSTGELSYLRQYQDGSGGIDGLGGVRSLLLSPGGGHLYAAGALDDAIAIFSVNPSSGLLSPAGVLRQTDPGLDGLNGVNDLAWGNGGTHLLATASANQSLAAFARNGSTGALTPAALVQDFQLPAAGGVLVDPSSLSVFEDQVFVTAAGSARVARFRFNVLPAPSFALDLVIANGQAGVSGMVQPRAVAYDPDQARLYVVSSAAGGLHVFSLLAAQPELLEQRGAAGFPVLNGATAVALSHNLRQLYSFGSSTGGIGVWARERGSRCPLSGERQIGSQTVDIAPGGEVRFLIGGDIFANALGSLDYTVRADTRVPTEELNPADNVATDSNTLQPRPDLAISKTDGLDEVVAGTSLQYDIDVSNAGVSDALLARITDLAPMFPGQTAGFSVGSGAWSCSANAPLAFTRAVTASGDPALAGVTAMVIDRDGSQMFAVNPATNALLVLPRQADGTLGAAQVIQNGSVLGTTTVEGMTGASNLALTGDGRHLLVTAATANSLLVFSRESDGSLRFRQKLTSGSGGVSGLLGAADVVVSSDGRRAFVASTQSNAIAVFSRDTATGQLSFVERVADGLGTIVPDSNVIRGVRRLHLGADGRHLYAVSTLSSALARFDVNAATGKLTYVGVHRSTGPGLAALAGARDLVAAPGDTQLYALGNAGIVQFNRASNGSLSVAGSHSTIPGLTEARALSLDAFGSRLYLSDSGGAVHVFARDWSNGALEHRLRFSTAGGELGAPNELLHVPSTGDLQLSSAAPGVIAQLDELPLSRCLEDALEADAIAHDVDLGAGGWAELLFDLGVHPSARGVLSNTATIAPGDGVDPSNGDNSATDQTTIVVVSDLAIDKTGPAEAIAGEQIAYRIEVRNSGPSDALGIEVIDTLSAQLLTPTWTCSSSGSSTCPASGSGNVAFTTDLLVGDVLTIDVSARISPSFVGTLINQASVVPETGASDPTPGDHVDEVQTLVTAVADVSVSKSNGVASVVAGTTINYQIDVGNAGPSDAPLVRVLDTLAASLLNPTWTCTGTGGAICPASGSGSPDFVAALPAGSALQLLVTATLSPSVSGTLTNTVTVEVQGGVLDPQLANNSASDSDPILIVPDLVLQIVDLFDPFDPAGTVPLPYIVTVTNAGPSDAHGVLLSLSQLLPVAFPPPSGCLVLSTTTLRCDLGTMAAGAMRELRFDFTGLPVDGTSFSQHGEVSTIDADPNLANNVVTQSTQLLRGASVRTLIDDGRTAVPMGYLTTYRVTVENVGSQPAAGVSVDLPIAPELVNAAWTCSSPNGAACTASGAGAIVDTVDLGAGQRVVYLLNAVVDPDLDASTPRTITQTVTIAAPPGVDIYPADNVATDIDDVIPVLFMDGFEDGINRIAVPQGAAAGCATDADTATQCGPGTMERQ